jgi:hypothetical protein
LAPEPDDAEHWGTGASAPQRVEWLISAVEPLVEMQKKVIDMEDGCAQLAKKNAACKCSYCSGGLPWIDDSTQRIEVAFISYNSEYGLISLVASNFFFNRGGLISKLVHVQSSWAGPFGAKFFTIVAMLLCDIIYLAALGKVLLAEVKEIIKVINSSKQSWYKAVKDDYIAFWNIVDWISILCAFSVLSTFVVLMLSTNEVNNTIRSTISLDAPTASDYETALSILFTRVEEMCGWERRYRTSFMFYPMVVMMRLFKSFDAQPRLAVVTKTLYVAMPGLVHFSIVFLSVYVCMVVMALLLIRPRRQDFGRNYFRMHGFVLSLLSHRQALH